MCCSCPAARRCPNSPRPVSAASPSAAPSPTRPTRPSPTRPSRSETRAPIPAGATARASPPSAPPSPPDPTEAGVIHRAPAPASKMSPRAASLGCVLTEIPESLRELARLQCGVLSRQQIFSGGVTRATLVWQLKRARWQQLQRGVYALFSGEPGREAELWAAVLRAGPGAVLSHHTAAELYRLA